VPWSVARVRNFPTSVERRLSPEVSKEFRRRFRGVTSDWWLGGSHSLLAAPHSRLDWNAMTFATACDEFCQSILRTCQALGLLLPLSTSHRSLPQIDEFRGWSRRRVSPDGWRSRPPSIGYGCLFRNSRSDVNSIQISSIETLALLLFQELNNRLLAVRE
jgi:hypothetical protein